MDDLVREAARLAGVAVEYTDFYGNVVAPPLSAIAFVLGALGYPCATKREAEHTVQVLRARQSGLQPVYVIPDDRDPRAALRERGLDAPFELHEREPGYSRLTADGRESTVIRTPSRAHHPADWERRKFWGISAQLYSLRSKHNWGIGDFGDLARLAAAARERRADAVALNPLHELNLTNAASASPYSPTSRLHLNVLYVDVPHAARFLGIPLETIPAGVEALRASELVDYPGVARAKIDALRGLYDVFRTQNALTPRFEAFCDAGGTHLRNLALYEALMAHFTARSSGVYGWKQWSPEYRGPDTPHVQAFARSHAGEVRFYQFAQWLADVQLADAASAAHGMAIGLYRDFAVGVDENSADVWGDAGAYALDLSVGAPPDPLNTAGQNWGLPPLNPRVLRERAYAPYVDLLRANMRHAGALRIDHVMGIMRLFCIPRGAPASEGTYVSFPLEDLTGILKLESRRHRCTIVGEDLGTVPPGFREHMERAGFLGCRLLYFEREHDGNFRTPQRYDAYAVASTGTHDLPPLAGFWTSADHDTRRQLLHALTAGHNLGRMQATRLSHTAGNANEDDLFELVLSAYRYLGRSSARLLLLQLEDVVLQYEQVNTPGTFDEMPNWRRKIALDLEDLHDDPRFIALTQALNTVRKDGTS